MKTALAALTARCRHCPNCRLEMWSVGCGTAIVVALFALLAVAVAVGHPHPGP